MREAWKELGEFDMRVKGVNNGCEGVWDGVNGRRRVVVKGERGKVAVDLKPSGASAGLH